MSFVAGWNSPGYLPESEPVEFDTEQEAFAYIVSNVELFWDQDTAAEYIDQDARWLGLHTELHNRGAASVPWSSTTDDGHLTFWVEFAEQAKD